MNQYKLFVLFVLSLSKIFLSACDVVNFGGDENSESGWHEIEFEGIATMRAVYFVNPNMG